MTKVDIISGFLGAGKTTFIKELIEKVFAGEKLVLIENEFGEIGIDGGFLQDAGIEITEMNSGCICCTLVGDFSVALKKVLDEYHPDHVIIEPSGVGKLSDVAAAIENVKEDADIEIEGRITVVDGKKAKMYLDNFGEFFENQVEHASTIVISRTQNMTDMTRSVDAVITMSIITTMMRSVHAAITMSIITIMTRSVDAVITMSIITIMMRSVVVDAATTIITMRMKCSQAGVRKLRTSTQRKSWITY